ncbi:MAG: metallophosphoesterase [Clostridiales bacterium]|nr:metallophosphoesterase [Clostridiales bacterium]
MIYMIFFAILVILAAAYLIFEATWLETTRHDFFSVPAESDDGSANAGIAAADSNAGTATADSNAGTAAAASGTTIQSGFKLLHISDLHTGYLLVSASRIKHVIDTEKPDIIVITGDNIKNARKVDSFLRLFSKIKGTHRAIICLGNHDYKYFRYNPKGFEDYKRKMTEAGAELLINEWVRVEKTGITYDIAAFDDYREGKPDVEGVLKSLEMAEASASLIAEGFMPVRIALAHNPDLVLQMPFKCFDYMFCGHYHGGQLRMPFHIEFIWFRKDILAKKGVRRGLNQVNGITLYLNRGLGNVLVPMRFLSRPEISVYRFNAGI